MTEPKGANRKKFFKRSKTGCMSCRIARKKCDEIKPSCSLCSRRKLQCVYANQTFKQFVDENGSDLVNAFSNRHFQRSKTGCLSCVKSKKKCDENKPQCDRCIRRNISCIYANSPPYSPSIEEVISLEETEYTPSLEIESPFDEQKIIPLKKNTLIRIPEHIPLCLNDNFSFDTCFNIFFNVTIKLLLPKESLEAASDFTLDLLKRSAEFRKMITSVSVAQLFSPDTSKHVIVNQIHTEATKEIQKSNEYKHSSELILFSLLFSILKKLYIKTHNREVLSDIYSGIELVLAKNFIKPTGALAFLTESLYYHYVLSILMIPNKVLDFYNPFILCDIFRNFFPKNVTRESNLLLWDTIDMMHIIAKTSFIFKKKSYQDEVYLNLLFETNCFLNEFAKSEKKMVYIALLTCKLMLLETSDTKFPTQRRGIIDEFFVAFDELRMKESYSEMFNLWGIFIIGLILERKLEQEKVIDYLYGEWEATHIACYLRAIDSLKFTWEENKGLEVLEDESVSYQIFLQ